MACINPNTPEFKAALERVGGNPLLAELEIDKGLNQIKPGVEELFDSNPELANAVYEALGFNGNVSKYQFPIYKGDVSKLETEGEGVSFFTRDKEAADYYTSSRQEQGISPKTNSTFKGYLDTKNPLIVDALKPSPIELKDANGNVLGVFGQKDYIQKVKDAGYDAIIINKKFGNSLDGWEIVSFNRSQIKTNLDTQITSQQKQQAQQLYSQYLDTIFPNNTIVYRGSEKGRTDFQTRGFFTDKLSYAKEYAFDKGFTSKSGKEIVNTFLINTSSVKNVGEMNTESVKNEPQDLVLKGVDKGRTKESGNVYATTSKNLHELGSKQDIQGFKEFVQEQKQPQELPNSYQNFLNLKPSTDITLEDWKQLTPEEQEVLINQAKNC